ncbi:MAG: fibronectin type III domain-containing protein [Candidatus Omnitrophota bacterium]
MSIALKRYLILGIVLMSLNGLAFGAISAQERAALIAFYNANDGDHWTYNSGWKGYNNAPDGFSGSGSESGWYGVSVAGNTVTGISQYNESRITQIPSEIVNLPNLEVLLLPGCKLSGNFPTPLLSLTKINALELSSNTLSGSIPAALGNLTSLQYLGLQGNNFSGSIPAQLGNLSQLISLDLSSNSLTGSIPNELANLATLKILFIYDNQLTGTIPSELGTYPSMVNLSNNQLTGSISKAMLYGPACDEYNGRWVMLAHNNLSGSLPSSDSGTGSFYQYLDLSDNQLSGSIPASLLKGSVFSGDPSTLDLSHNNLSGSIPSEIGECTEVEFLDLSDNKLTGTIPKEIAGLTCHPDIDLSRNSLSGEIPKEFWGFQWYKASLNGNMLSGVIPVDVLQYPGRLMDMGYNAFSATDAGVIAYLNQVDPDWAQTQTVLPTHISAAALTSDSVRISWTPIGYTADSGGYTIYYSTTGSGSWIKAGKTADKSASSVDVTGLTPGTTYYFIVRTATDAHANNANTVITGFSDAVSASTLFIPADLSISRTQFYFSGVSGKANPASQSFIVSNSGGGVLNWTAACNQTWLHATPSTGTGWREVDISVDITGLSSGTYNGVITLTAPDATHSPQTVQVQLIVKAALEDQAPIGVFETPVSGSTVNGSVPLTGWALDDTGMDRVKIYREPISGEPEGLVYVGDVTFVEGARPDVEAAYPGYPNNYKAGWGYMLLTNFLPGQGNGTFVLHAVAYDTFGNQTTLGTKTISCDNSNAATPFGAIDTPAQGGTVSGGEYVNFGWALTPQPNIIPVNGTTINVWIDGKSVGHPVYNQYREDVAALFPGLNNSNGAGGYFYMDTRGYANGIHTLAWTATDDAGNEGGIGSRYFMIQNAQSGSTTVGSSRLSSIHFSEEPNESKHIIRVKRGYSEDSEFVELSADENGNVFVEIRELEPVAIHLASGVKWETALPIGSTWEEESGIFYWLPGPGFIGTYTWEFTQPDESGASKMRKMVITVTPKF